MHSLAIVTSEFLENQSVLYKIILHVCLSTFSSHINDCSDTDISRPHSRGEKKGCEAMASGKKNYL